LYYFKLKRIKIFINKYLVLMKISIL